MAASGGGSLAGRDPRLARRTTRAAGQNVALLGISGGIAGGIAKTTVAPLERVKLLLQTGQSTSSITMTLSKVVHHEGFWGLWRGNTVNVVRMVPSKCVLLSCSDLYKDAMGLTHLSTFAQGGIAGAFAGCTATMVTYPLDLARTRMAGMLHVGGESSLKARAGALETMRIIAREEGVSALYRGASPTVLGALPYEGIKFGTYDWLKRHAHWPGSEPSRGGHGPLWRACCGAAAAMLAHLLTYPNDTIRRRLQMQGASGEGSVRYRGWLDCWRSIVRNEGWAGLYRGLGVTMLRSLPNTGIQFAVYEACKDLIAMYEGWGKS